MIKTMKIILAAAAVVSIGVTATALAQSGLSGLANQVEVMRTNFSIADKDHDGYLTKKEAASGYTAYLDHHFDEIDVRKEGKISQQDVADYWKEIIRKANAREKAAAAAATH